MTMTIVRTYCTQFGRRNGHDTGRTGAGLGIYLSLCSWHCGCGRVCLQGADPISGLVQTALKVADTSEEHRVFIRQLVPLQDERVDHALW